MKNRIFAIIAVFALLLSLLTACGSKAITAAEAQAIAMEDLGISSKDVQDAHTHILTEGGAPSYSIHITTKDAEYEYVISADGKIVSSEVIG